jgi:2TM domain
MAGTRRDRGIVIHFTTYVAINLSLLLINLFVDRAHFWFFWPLLVGAGAAKSYLHHRTITGLDPLIKHKIELRMAGQ